MLWKKVNKNLTVADAIFILKDEGGILNRTKKRQAARKHIKQARWLAVVLLLVFSFLCTEAEGAAVTSPFGWRTHPVTGEWKFHTGLDIGYEYGDGIAAMLPGRVVYAAEYGGYGNCIILEHEGGDHTLYAHCSAIYVSYGQYVDQGSVIGAVGDSGLATGAHLHLEWWHNGKYTDPMGLWR